MRRLDEVAPGGWRDPAWRTAGLVAVGKCEWLLFIYALSNGPAHLAVMVFQLWPVALTLCLVGMNRSSRRYLRVSWVGWAAVAAVVAGASAVVVPETAAGSESTSVPALAAAVAAVTLSGSHNAAIQQWGDRMARRSAGVAQAEARAFWCVWMQGFGQALALGPLLVAAAVLGQSIALGDGFAAVGLGFVTAGVGDLLFRWGLSLCRSPAVAALAYVEPVLALLWLQLAFGLSLSSPVLALLGTAVIVGGNCVIALWGSDPAAGEGSRQG